MKTFPSLADALARASVSKEERKLAAWSKASMAVGKGVEYRQDDLGRLMRWRDYGNRSSFYGWEIDHILPIAMGGTDDLSNLRALHWQSNASLGGRLGGLLSS